MIGYKIYVIAANHRFRVIVIDYPIHLNSAWLGVRCERQKGSPKNVALSFWTDANGGSPARNECIALRSSYQTEVTSILAHVQAVEQVGNLSHNPYLKQAQRNQGTPPKPDLYWWEVNGVGVFYAYDGVDLVIVLMGRVGNPPAYSTLLAGAEGRL